MDIFERIVAAAKASDRRIVMPEGEDGRIVRAARRLLDDGIATPVLLGRRAEIVATALAAETALDGITVIDPDANERLDAYARAYTTARRRLNSKLAYRLARKPLYFAAMMVAEGDADAMVAGVAHPTRRVIEAGLLGIGLADGIHIGQCIEKMRKNKKGKTQPCSSEGLTVQQGSIGVSFCGFIEGRGNPTFGVRENLLVHASCPSKLDLIPIDCDARNNF